MRKIALIGGNGRLATAIRNAHAKGAFPGDIEVFGRAACELPQGIPDLLHIDFDVLINCVAYHKVDEVESDLARAFRINSYAVRDLALVCERKRAVFVHVSTDYVFGGTPPAGEKYTETDRSGPLNVYGASKLMGESMARSAWFDTAIVRVASLFGQTQSAGKGPDFVQTMLAKAKTGNPVNVVDDFMMSPTSAADAAHAILLIAQHRAVGTWHVVNSGPSATWYTFAREILRTVGISPHATEKPVAPLAIRPHFSALDNKKLQGSVITMPLWEESLRTYLKELR